MGILYRVEDKEDGCERQQVLVPQKYWGNLLRVAHTTLTGGHLGRDKREARLNQWVFWSSLYKMVERYCVEGPEWQKTRRMRPTKTLLVPLPAVG